MVRRILLACFLAIAVPSASGAEEAPKAEVKERPAPGGLASSSARAKPLQVSGPMERAIRKLIQVTNGLQTGMQALDQIFAQLRPLTQQIPDDTWNRIVAEVRGSAMQDLEALLVPIYARHYTLEEVEGLIAFYESPLGKATIEKMPAVMGEAMAVGGAWGEAVMERMFERAEAASQPATFEY